MQAFEINLAGIEFIGNYFSRAYGPFAGVEDEDEGGGGGGECARGRMCNGGCECTSSSENPRRTATAIGRGN